MNNPDYYILVCESKDAKNKTIKKPVAAYKKRGSALAPLRSMQNREGKKYKIIPYTISEKEIAKRKKETAVYEARLQRINTKKTLSDSDYEFLRKHYGIFMAQIYAPAVNLCLIGDEKSLFKSRADFAKVKMYSDTFMVSDILDDDGQRVELLDKMFSVVGRVDHEKDTLTIYDEKKLLENFRGIIDAYCKAIQEEVRDEYAMMPRPLDGYSFGNEDYFSEMDPHVIISYRHLNMGRREVLIGKHYVPYLEEYSDDDYNGYEGMSLRKFVENVLSYRSNYAGKVYKIGHICEGMI